MRPVLVTRAEPGAARTLARLEALGHRTVNAATARIVFRDAALDLETGEALALTSPNGAVAAARLTGDRALPVFTVGSATAEAARAQGFTDIVSADGDGAALAALIVGRAGGPVVHVHGRDQSFDLVSALETSGFAARGVTAYAAEPVEALSEDALTALHAGGVVLVHSSKGAERFVALARKAGVRETLATTRAAAISSAAAAPLKAAGVEQIIVAERPDEEALLEALDRAVR
ncbi:MAG: uroporphyrinogen-III synthase [Alphaproteobacteria bacterium]|nr:uroporphyrinogen-III synthase [Alphaproteobacteria bacterium]